MGETIKRLILGYIPSNRCNLKCKYCYISQIKDWGKEELAFRYPIEQMAEGLSKERLGGVAQINITAQGETLLVREIDLLVEGLLRQGHFVEIVTNGTVDKVINKLISLPEELASRLMFKISFHYQELVERKMIDKFFANVDRIKNSPCSFTLEMVPQDELEGQIDEILNLCRERAGAPCHLTIGRKDDTVGRGLLTEHSKEEYLAAWQPFESRMFDVKMELMDNKRREFCYAGDWSFFLNFQTGEIQPCYGQPVVQNIWEDIKKPIHFQPVGCCCTQPYCINGHAHLTFGVIPSLDLGSYAQIRDRVCNDGSHWLKGEMREFYSSKLSQSNEILTPEQERKATAQYRRFCACQWIKNPKKIAAQVKRQARKLSGKLSVK